MPRYTVHGKSAEPEAIRAGHLDLRFVKDGFSWWGLFFPLPWLIIKAMWLVVFFAIAAMVAIGAAGSALGLGDATIGITILAINLIIGFEGYDLLRWTLSLRGYKELDLASGADREEAEFRYFAALPDSAPPPPARLRLGPETHDPLGLFGAPGTA